MSSILEILECPVCLATPSSIPIYQCVSNGHVVCKTCVMKLDNVCPVCRQTKGFNRCLTAEKLFAEYNKNHVVLASRETKHTRTRRRCGNYFLGCRSYHSYDHEMSCSFRQIYCPDLTCQKKVSLLKLFDEHFKDEHPDVVMKPGNVAMTFRLCVRQEHWGLTTSYKPVRFEQNNQNFFREIRRDDEHKSWYFWVYFDGEERESRDYAVQYQLLNERKEVVLTHHDQPVPLDCGLEQVMLEYRGLILPDEFLKRKIIRNDEFYLILSVKRR